MDSEIRLSARALAIVERALADHEALRIAETRLDGGGRLVDFGVRARGGLEAGRVLALACMADLGRVDLAPHDPAIWDGPAVCVRTDQPVLACMASQYAGWRISVGKFFAMGSGPMRAAAAKEPLFEKLGIGAHEPAVVGVLETSKLPGYEVFEHVASACGVSRDQVTLLVAPTASLAGTFQVVARSVETALHKLMELKFDITAVESAWGVAPLPPPAANDIAAIGRTNDAILYGGQVTLWVRSDDEELRTIGPHVPSSASSDHGRPFEEVFRDYGGDFYKIDPHLFSPGVVRFVNLATGRTFVFGRVMSDVLRRSFEGS